MQILQTILVVIAILGLLFGKWVGPLLAKVLTPVINTPAGAVLVTLALLVFIINIINWFISLGRINSRRF